MPIFSYSVLIGSEEKTTGFVYCELLTYIVRAQTRSNYIEYLSDEEEEWDTEGSPTSLFDNKNVHVESLQLQTLNVICLRSYISDFGEIKKIDPDILDGCPVEIFSKTMRFESAENYHKFASASDTTGLCEVGVYSNPDRYFMRAIE